MVIRTFCLGIGTLLIMSLCFSCKKGINICPKQGYEYSYTIAGALYEPAIDSFPLGNTIVLSSAVPKSFFSSGHNQTVFLNLPEIEGPLRVIKPTYDPATLFEGAIDDVDFSPITGSLTKDSIHFTAYQLKSFRTVHWDGSSTDSFKIKINIKPKYRGVYIVNLGQQGNRDTDCALYKYFIKVKNPDQHLYFLAQANNGYIDDYSRNYAYCFKVY